MARLREAALDGRAWRRSDVLPCAVFAPPCLRSSTLSARSTPTGWRRRDAPASSLHLIDNAPRQQIGIASGVLVHGDNRAGRRGGRGPPDHRASRP